MQVDQPAVFLQVPADGRELVLERENEESVSGEVERARPRHGTGRKRPYPNTYLLGYCAEMNPVPHHDGRELVLD